MTAVSIGSIWLLERMQQGSLGLPHVVHGIGQRERGEVGRELETVNTKSDTVGNFEKIRSRCSAFNSGGGVTY